MSDTQCYKTPIADLLRAIPKGLVIQYETHEGKVWHNCPIGREAHEAADEIKRLTEELADIQDQRTKLAWCYGQSQAELTAARAKIAELEKLVPKWISVNERVPEMEVPVLVISEPWPSQISAAMRFDGGEGWLWAVSQGYHRTLNDKDSYECDDDYKFSYWMPLPVTPSPISHSGPQEPVCTKCHGLKVRPLSEIRCGQSHCTHCGGSGIEPQEQDKAAYCKCGSLGPACEDYWESTHRAVHCIGCGHSKECHQEPKP